MLLVDTYVDFALGKGLGLFAKAPIPADTIYWTRNENFDRIIPASQLKLLPRVSSDFFMNFGFLEVNGNWYLCTDHARFSNHAESPNTKNHFGPNGLLVQCTSLKFIEEGEEILINYREICQTCKDGVGFVELR